MLIAILALTIAGTLNLISHRLRKRKMVRAENTYDAAVETHENTVTRTNDSAVSTRHLLWYQTGATTVDLASATTPALGTIDNTESSTGLRQTVNLLGRGPTKKVVANGAIAVNAPVFQDASGKVGTSGSIYVGKALTAAASDGDIIELDDCAPKASTLGAATVAVLTAANELTAADSGKTLILAHATEFATTLPAPALGLRFTFIVGLAPSGASYTVVTNGGTNLIYGCGLSSADAGGNASSTAGTAADTITFVNGQAAIGDRVDIVSDGTNWYAIAFMGDEDAITFSAT